tara:strand:- start:494 stop:1024 length:531 start_codon:yes stop_codon:yes gene_type:complete
MIQEIDSATEKSKRIELITKVEAVLYIKGRPVTKKSITELTNSDINSVSEAIKELKFKYSETNSALEILENESSISLELKQGLNDFVEDLLPAELKTSVLRTLATVAIKKKILQSDLIILRGSGAYDHIKELLDKKFIVKRKQKEGRSYWISLSEKFFQTFAVSNDFLSNIGDSNL